ncbi:MAG TPA: ATPase, T2SS/T4P/T4SS family [Kineosporiaceae bacterium]|nr:ATPase, T2SS/T4P/T4SS family [Kineosporiaceae bacterium]
MRIGRAHRPPQQAAGDGDHLPGGLLAIQPSPEQPVAVGAPAAPMATRTVSPAGSAQVIVAGPAAVPAGNAGPPAAGTGPTVAAGGGLPAPIGPGALRLGEVLVGAAVLTAAQLAEALGRQTGSGKRIGSLLVELGLISERDLVHALATQLRMPVADLTRRAPDPGAQALLPEPLARRLQVVPLARSEDGLLHVATSDPAAGLLEELGRATGRPVRLYLTTQAETVRAVNGLYRALSGVDEQVAAFASAPALRAGVQRIDVGVEGGDDAPVVRVVNMVLTQALRDRASDVHVEPQDGRVRVRFRIDGALHDVLTLPAEMGGAIASRIKIMGGMNIVERRRPQDGQIATTIDDRAVDIRVSTMGTVYGEKVVLRILDKSKPLYRLGDLGMPPSMHQTYSRLIRSPYGMVICAGPTGSGKTTTLYASLTEVNGVDKNVTTIEDPVEYVFPSINQIQINDAAGVTFASGLKSILRQDPDMILVGEMRDVETSRIAVQSALTGHFVLSSLHATDSVSALYRFLDMGIESFLVASSVIGVVGQRLVRRMCRYCRVPYAPTAEEESFYREAGGPAKDRFWIGEGCNYCSGTGYSDRVGVYELLTVTEEIREILVRPNPSHDELRRVATRQGLVPLRVEGARLVAEDVTTTAEIIRSIYTL